VIKYTKDFIMAFQEVSTHTPQMLAFKPAQEGLAAR
jgi:hypothetical protein